MSTAGVQFVRHRGGIADQQVAAILPDSRLASLHQRQARSSWCAPRGRERWSPLWRPFEGPLCAAAQRQALSILKNRYGFLVDQNYLMGNPWLAVGAPRNAGPKLNAGRSLRRAQWAFVQQLEVMGNASAQRRLKL